MATASSALQMFDVSSSSFMRITKSMRLITRSYEQMQMVAGRNRNASRILAAKQQLAAAEVEISWQIEKSAKAQAKFNKQVDQGKSKTKRLLDTFKKVVTKNPVQKIQAGMRIADEYANTTARLNMINDGTQTTAELQDKIFAAAARSRVSYTDMAAAVAKMGAMAGHRFGSNDEMIAFAELVQKAFVASGSDAAQQQTAMSQLTEALASGSLQGDQFVSILENAPMLAQAIARYTGVGMEKLQELANQGFITSDILIAALFSAADEINAKFEETSHTFGSLWNGIVTIATRQFAPLFEKIGEMLNDPKTLQFINSLAIAFGVVATMASILFGIVGNVFSFIVENWSFIAPVITGIVAAMIAYKTIAMASAAASAIKAYAQTVLAKGLKAAATAQLGLNAAMLASPITLIILGLIAIVAVIYLVVAAINRFAGTSISATGVIVGAIAVLGAFIWNTIVSVINAVIQFVWTHFVEPWIGIIEFVLNIFRGGFDSFGDAVKNLLGQIISWFLSLGKIVTKIIDAIFGTEWTKGLEDLQDSVLSWGKNDQAITLDRDAPTLSRIGYGDAWDAGYDWGSNLISRFEGLDDMAKKYDHDYEDLAKKYDQTSKFDQDFEELAKKYDQTSKGSDFDQTNQISELDHIGKVDEVGRISDTVDISSEDLKTMRELAELKSIQNFVTLTPTVQVTTGDLHREADIDVLVTRIEQKLEEEFSAAAEGVYG